MSTQFWLRVALDWFGIFLAFFIAMVYFDRDRINEWDKHRREHRELVRRQDEHIPEIADAAGAYELPFRSSDRYRVHITESGLKIYTHRNILSNN